MSQQIGYKCNGEIGAVLACHKHRQKVTPLYFKPCIWFYRNFCFSSTWTMSNPIGNNCRVQMIAVLACHTHCQKVAPPWTVLACHRHCQKVTPRCYEPSISFYWNFPFWSIQSMSNPTGNKCKGEIIWPRNWWKNIWWYCQTQP